MLPALSLVESQGRDEEGKAKEAVEGGIMRICTGLVKALLGSAAALAISEHCKKEVVLLFRLFITCLYSEYTFVYNVLNFRRHKKVLQ